MNDSLSLPFFTQGSSSYPPTPPFPDNYDGQFTNSQDEFYSNGYDLDGAEGSSGLVLSSSDQSHGHRSNGVSYPFPTPATSRTDGQTPTFSHNSHSSFPPNSASSSYLNNFYTNPAFLDVGLSGSTPRSFNPAQAGPSTYSRPSSSGEEYLQAPDDDEDDFDPLVKLEDGDANREGDEDEEGAGGEVDNEEPLYVNAKQYHRILKRRAARQRLEELNRLARSRKPYLHESRHRHACSRPRGKGGRFLTAEEIEAMKKEEAAKAVTGGLGSNGDTPDDDSDSSRPSTSAAF